MDLSALPSPPVPAGFSLRERSPMPLSAEQILNATQFVEYAHEPIIGAAWIRLRAKAWTAMPAASLPASNYALSALCGLTPENFARYRTQILAGFVLCSDGRYYDVELADRIAELIAAHARREELRRMKSKAGRASVAARKAKAARSVAAVKASKAVSIEAETCDTETNPLGASAREVFAHWCETMGVKKAILSGKRKTNLFKCLQFYSVEDLKKAVRGCSLSPFHMGENERRTRYNDLELICRDPSMVEKFMAFADSPPTVRRGLFGRGGRARPEDYRTDEPMQSFGWLAES
jgi:hypothetical protein